MGIKGAKVSIIIPTYNRGHLIAETLDSIIAQTYTNWECIIVDDGSTDDTKSIIGNYLKKDNRFLFYNRPIHKPKGANACRNYGLKKTKGNYINWFDSDDLMHPSKLELQVKQLEGSSLFFSVCQSIVFEGTIDNVKGLKSDKIISDNTIDDFLRKKIVWLTQAPLFKKQFLLEHNFLFNEQLQAGQEWHLFAKILLDFPFYEVIEQPLCYLRIHQDSISTNTEKAVPLFNYFLARFYFFREYKSRLNKDNTFYLKHYFLFSFKELLRLGAHKKAFYVWKNVLLKDDSFKFVDHINLVLSILSFGLFGKGDRFLSKVSKYSS